MNLKELLASLDNPEKLYAHFPQGIDSYIDHFVPHVLLKSHNLQEAFGVNVEEMNSLYEEAYLAYEEIEDFEKAHLLFRWLVILNPFIWKYWMGLAAALQMLGKYEKALHSYAVAYLLDTNHPHPHLYAHECYSALGNKEEAKKALMLAEEKTKENRVFHTLLDTIQKRKGSCL